MIATNNKARRIKKAHNKKHTRTNNTKKTKQKTICVHTQRYNKKTTHITQSKTKQTHKKTDT